jgi:predicted TIM-barrel fold metal-dependent hydrolase
MIAAIDAHHHIWRQADLPWLMGPMLPRIFGPYESIRRDYSIGEYLADLKDLAIVRSVYVQANWAPDRFEDEVAWVQNTANETGWPHGIVAYANFLADDVRPELDRLRKYPLMRGVRMQLHWHQNPQYRFAARPDFATDPTFQRNVDHLAEYDWAFDLQVFADQMPGAAELASACSGVTFVLQHAGMPEDLTVGGYTAWRAGMERLARCPNVVAKLSGLGTFIHRNDAAHILRIVKETLELFGSGRCLFGSNFPIEKLWTDYATLLGSYRSAIKSLSTGDQRAVLHDTAANVYRIN